MIERFILNNAKETFEIIQKKYFERYDLNSEYSQLIKEVDEYKRRFGREPFLFDLINPLLINLSGSTAKSVKRVLYTKDKDWFFNIGQYLFYNTYFWSKNLNFQQDGNNEAFTNAFSEKWWNIFLTYEKEKAHDYDQLSIPRKILLELTNNCNLSCIMCGIGAKPYDPTKNLSMELLISLSKNILNKVNTIRLNGLGESTFLPNFLEYLDILKKLPAQLEIVTNLTVKNIKIWKELVNCNTNFLISCDSSSAPLYELIRKGAKFANFIKNLKFIGESISNPLQAQIIFTLMDLNYHQISKIVELTAKFGLGGVIVNVVKSDPNEDGWIHRNIGLIMEEFQKAYDLSESCGITLKLPDHLGNIPINKEISNPSCNILCNHPWEEVYIRYNGDLTVCNMLNPYIYGNCQNYPFEKIWNGLNAEMFRNFVNTDYRHYYCKECYYLI